MIKNIIRIIFLVILLAGIGYAWLAISSSASCSKKEVETPELKPPYYLVQTHSVPYAGKNVLTVENGDLTAYISAPYYVMFDGRWILRNSGNLTIKESTYGPFTVRLIRK